MTTGNQISESLTEALAKAQIPSENHEFIRRITSAVGVVEFHAVVTTSKTYIKAVRRDGHRNLHINFGYTNGFSEDELIRIAGGATRGASTRKGTWWVEHPVTKVRPGSARTLDKRREGAFCPCGMQLSLTGACANCD
ncbi:hypothetical protein [Mycobacterium sp. ITM-2016-00318]|uniref:hypothetical protein n=1 Tax=Mycobacterium sp. ITM-2016-00318 TaxID=2099693 RepID=UPI000CF8BDBD|nr:hypothetical protein [Mycobacterium sp. ITM-2016-00318]WNG94740.1 hypothetical protein C6A82_010095 [Mycobacterium sp. ITM-2016-00318]